jgi:hypothetical protein
MANSLRLQISRRAKNFLDELAAYGIDNRQAIAQGLWLLEEAYKTHRLALLAEGWHTKELLGDVIDEIYLIERKPSNTDYYALDIANSRTISALDDKNVNEYSEVPSGPSKFREYPLVVIRDLRARMDKLEKDLTDQLEAKE